MKQFFKFLLASVLGFFVSLFLLIFVFFIFSFALISSFSSTEIVSIPDNSILELRLDYDVPERSSYEPISNFSIFPSMGKTIGLNDINRLIKNSKADERIKGIFLDLDNLFVGGLAKINSIRESLRDFKSSGKFIVAHGNSISEKAFFLGSVADSIYLTPTGVLEFDGFGIEIAFFRNALEKLEIEPQIFQHGKYKSATEPFKLDKLSKENKVQLEAYLNSIYKNFIAKISEDTKIGIDSLFDFASALKINSAESAKNYGFVNELLYEDEVDSMLNKLGELDSPPKKISLKNYLYSMDGSSSSGSDRIAVIYALGEIINGSGDEYNIGTKNIIEAIKKAKDNRRVKGIVMRVNSPGGSPLTSDMIWREINITSNKKPFIVSMGDIAASGGYYISCNADRIVAEENTLAGSIGVYGIIPNTQKFFNNKLGISFDRVETSEFSSLYTITTPLSPQQRSLIENQIDDVYFDFVTRVANGRKMTYEEVDKIAQGRIWSGIDAVNIGLADTIGGLQTAIDIAADKAGITEYKIIEYPAQKEAFEKIFDLLYSEMQSNLNNFIFNESLNQIENLYEALKYTGIQTRLPFTYNITY